MVRNSKQDSVDAVRAYYELVFPADLEEQGVRSWLRAISTSLNTGGGLRSPVQTIVFEMMADSRQIRHLIGMHRSDESYVIGQLRTHIPGVRAEPYKREVHTTLQHVAEIGMTNPNRMLSIPDSRALSASILASVQTLAPQEVVILQWIITPAKNDAVKRNLYGDVLAEKQLTSTHLLRALSTPRQVYVPVASNDEVRERTEKLAEPNMLAVGRVAAYSPTDKRAEQLLRPVITALRSTKNSSTSFKEVGSGFRNALDSISSAETPSKFPAQLNLIELAAVVGWPIGSPHVGKMPQGASRHLPANEGIPRVGRVLGKSNFPNNERPLAIGRPESLVHLHVMGGTGVGKTTLLASLVAQDMKDGYGVVVMESKGDLFKAVMDLVPSHRVQDVIVMNVRDTTAPLGFNVLDQGNANGVIDQLADLFQSLYNGGGKDIWFRELLYFGLRTLAEHEGMTFVDLATLISPRTPDETVWADHIKSTVKDQQLREFWQLRWNKMDVKERERNAASLHNRIWQITSRPELRNIIGQSVSSFQMDDVLRSNKILLINLEKVPQEAASMMGTFIMNAVWSSAQRVHATTPNYVYLDEFQDFTRLPVSAEDMLAKARSFNLGLTLAHQHLGQLPQEVQSAIAANAKSKLYFEVSDEDVKIVKRALRSDAVSDSDLANLGKFEAIARIAIGTGSSSPVTLITLPPVPSTGNRDRVTAASRATYGRSVAQIEASTNERRRPTNPPSTSRPSIGFSLRDRSTPSGSPQNEDASKDAPTKSFSLRDWKP